MDFLFDNPIANMPGPLFLVFYGIVIGFSAISFYFFKPKLDRTLQQPLPRIPQTPDPYEIAYLRGGENELARSLIFSLFQKGFLQITNDGKNSYIVLNQNQPNWTILPQIERNILGWFQNIREIKEVFQPYGLVNLLKPYSMEYENKLKQNNFLTSEDIKTKTRLISYLIFGLTAVLGGYKLTASIVHGRYNLIFLISFIIISFIIFTILGNVKRLSQKGIAYLENLQRAFEKLRDDPISARKTFLENAATMNSAEPMLLTLGLFGVSSLIGSGYSEYERAFEKSQKADMSGGYFSSTGSSCGSGCSSYSSCSSGDSGSSCSGGSSCGGGCGGGCGGS